MYVVRRQLEFVKGGVVSRKPTECGRILGVLLALRPNIAPNSDPAYHGWSKMGQRSNKYYRWVELNYLCSIGREKASVKEKLLYKVAICPSVSEALCKQSP